MMPEDPIVVRSKTAVRGEIPDTKAWLARYGRYRQDVVATLRRVPAFVEAFRQLVPNELYRIVWSPEMVTAIRERSAVWKPAKDGFLRAVLRKPGGGILKHLPLERVRPIQLAPMIQLATQSMLAEVFERLEIIDQKVSAMLRGQVADRIGALLGAEFQFMAALKASGDERLNMFRQCIGPLEKARGVLIASLQSELKALDLSNPGWLGIFPYLLGKPSPEDRIKEAMDGIHLYLLGTIRATRYLEATYEELGQTASAKEALALFANAISDFLPYGCQGAQGLPYDRANPPEELWDQTRRMIQGPFNRVQGLLAAPSLPVEIEVKANEIVGSEMVYE